MPFGRNPLILLSGSTMLVGGWLAWSHHQHDKAGSGSDSDWQKRTPAAARKIVDRPNPVPVAADRPAALPVAAPAAEPAGPAAADGPAAPADDGPGSSAPTVGAPDAATLENYYTGLFRRLNFTPEQVAQFRSLRDQAILDAVNALPPAERERLANSPAAIRQMMFTSDSTLDARVLQQFGDVVYTQYKQDQQTFPQRVTVDQFDQTLRAAGSGLSDEQANQLVLILAHTGVPGTKSDTSRISQDALNAAAAVLTPEQLLALQQFQTAQPPAQP
jgi:Spy/CpxP family protein refolding chaperone